MRKILQGFRGFNCLYFTAKLTTIATLNPVEVTKFDVGIGKVTLLGWDKKYTLRKKKDSKVQPHSDPSESQSSMNSP